MEHIYSIDELRKCVTPVFTKHGVNRAILFGSYGKGNARRESDIDLLVDSGLRGLNFVSLCEDLRRSLGVEIDLFDVSHIQKGSRIDQEIAETGVVLYEK